MSRLPYFIETVQRLPIGKMYGKVHAVKGLLIECLGLEAMTSVGAHCIVYTRSDEPVMAEVVGFQGEITLLMPFSEPQGIGSGCKVMLQNDQPQIFPTDAWRGRVVNALAEPVDEAGILPMGTKPYSLKSLPPDAHKRSRVEGKMDLGIRAFNTFMTCCQGQRMGIFAGSGVGKSMLIAMLTKYCQADIKVIGLIGERGREVQEFLQDYLGEEGLKSAVVVVATGDESALMRRQAAYTTMTIAEYFRDQGKEVLCMMDSVTRFAMAQREIGLSAGEPPTTKGYTPTVFSEMPKLLERAGPGVKGSGSITGIFSVLVEGDDQNEPVADAVRGILDGHIILDRRIAERGRFPAIDVLRSVSRTMPGCNSDAENELVTRARRLMSTYQDMAELIRIGAYRQGSDPLVDEAIAYHDALEEFLSQKPDEHTSLQECYARLERILAG